MASPQTPDTGWMGDRARGASLGRSNTGRPTAGLKFTLNRVRLDQGGYDQGGAYWGFGVPLYYFASADGAVDGYVRSRTRDDAKYAVAAIHPEPIFYR